MRLRVQWKVFIVALAFIEFSSANALEVSRKSDIQTSEIGRYWNQSGLLKRDYDIDNLTVFANQLTTELIKPSDADDLGIDFELRHEFRILNGNAAGAPSDALDFIPIEKTERYLKLSGVLVANDNFHVVSDFEKINFQTTSQHVDTWIGRKPVSLGSLSFFRIWNQFTRPVSGIFGPTLIYGSDGAGLKVHGGNSNLQLLSLQGSSSEWTANLVEGEVSFQWGEVKLLAGKWWNNWAGGVSFSIPVNDWLLKGESLSWAKDQNSSTLTMAGLGLEGGFKQWSATFEVLYQSFGKTETSQYSVLPETPFSSFRAAIYNFLRVENQLSAFSRAQVGLLINGIDGGTMIQSGFRYSISDESEAAIEYSFPIGPSGAEFSSRSFDFGNGIYLGAGQQLVLTFKTSF
jgi:hypothetical protein